MSSLVILGDWNAKIGTKEIKRYLEEQTNLTLKYKMKLGIGEQSFAKRMHLS